jgi:hypothetical protein
MKKRMLAGMALGATAALLGLVTTPALAATAATAATAWSGGYTCTGGDVPPGYYQSVTIDGLCYMTDGLVTVQGDLVITPGSLLDAGATLGDPAAGTHVVPATVDIRGSVFVGKGAVLVLGCSVNLLGICNTTATYDTVGGNLTAYGAEADVLHNVAVRGNVSVLGGGGGAAGGAASGACDASTYQAPAPWSQDPALAAQFVPQYTDFEDGSVGGNLTIAGVHTCWMGALREQVGGNYLYAGNRTSDPDGDEIGNNLVSGNMACLANDPAVQWGDSGAAPNIVGGNAVGQCSFDTVLPNPAPEADEGAGVGEHFAVASYSLPTYTGTHASTLVDALPPVTTDAGNTITADLNDFTMTGSGLTGSGTFSPSIGPGNSGDAVLTVTRPDHFGQFLAYDACDCSFGGQSGTILLRFYGTVLPSGQTYGTFLVVSGGLAPMNGPGAAGGLDTLAGYGTFYGSVNSWRLVEHLRIT